MSTPPLLSATGVSLGSRLAPTNLALNEGNLTAVIGPNGSGKTSLLRALGRVERPGGQVLLDGRDLDRQSPAWRASQLGYLPAGREMSWSIPVRDLIQLGAAPDPARLHKTVASFELADLIERPADALSTGERSRVLLARLLALPRRLLLLDEPLSHLDPYWVVEVLRLLREAADEGTAVVMTLHDLHQLDRFDRVLMLANGLVRADGTPQEVLNGGAFEEVFRLSAEAVAGLR